MEILSKEEKKVVPDEKVSFQGNVTEKHGFDYICKSCEKEIIDTQKNV